jgi:hypothetical protein
MIWDGRMPTHEEAEQKLRERQEQDRQLPTTDDVRGLLAPEH